MLLPASLAEGRQWQGILGWRSSGREESQSVEGDVAAGGHTRVVGIDFRKIGPGGTWRNAVLISPGGFFVEQSILEPGDVLKFYVARVDNASGDASVTLSTSGGQLPVWREACKKLPANSWQSVSVKLNAEGSADAVFELTGDAPKAVVAFADVHFEKVHTYERATDNSVKSPGRTSGTNVILVLVDALRADRLSMAGYKVATSPEIDSLATRAVVFDNCLSQASWTLPSMATIFTSLYPSVHGMETADSGLPGGLETLAECFQKAGYRTCCIQPNSLMDPNRGVARGFDEYHFLRMRKATRDDRSMHKRAAVVNDLGLSWLKRNADNPFFLYLHYMDVHNPYWPPKEFRKYGEHMWQLYDGGVAYVSSEFAELFDAIDKMGLLGNTTIVFTGDHGEQFLEHGSTYHGNCLHQEEVHVPLIIWSPVVKPNVHIPAQVGLIDLPVTILDLAGLRPMPFAQGRSLVPLMRGTPCPGSDVFGELVKGTVYPGPKILSLTRGNWRLISPAYADVPKLYNLAEDPGEHKDFAAANPALTRQMSEALKAYYETQVALNSRLVKAKVQVTVTEEQRKALAAIGYLMGSSDDSAASATSER
ncbi:MAG: sulfatase-like hydrolase/transferase [Planctomycetes bacterium]|nr:sulfatase-like hydrolase/transferase [Planctomycetota bacterium]